MSALTQKLQDSVAKTKELTKEKVIDRFPWYISAIIFLIIALVIFTTLFGWYISQEPAMFSVQEETATYIKDKKLPNSENTGMTTSITLYKVIDTLLHKPGGYVTNDVAPPGIFMDNMPNWEKGVIFMSRSLARSMRQDFTRSQSQSTEDVDLAEAEPKLNYDNNHWIFPETEGEYGDGLARIESYIARLSNSNPNSGVSSNNSKKGATSASFYARADNLATYLREVHSRLGSLSQRLSASAGEFKISKKTTGELENQSGNANRTPWMEIDDIFYEARGNTWALVHFMKAIEVDFADVLAKKNAVASFKQVIKELEGTQQTLWSPLILNGSGFGLVANHSLVMANYISRANAALGDLLTLLNQG